MAKPIKKIVKELGLADNFNMMSDFRRARTSYEHSANELTDSQARELAFSMLHDQKLSETIYNHPEAKKK